MTELVASDQIKEMLYELPSEHWRALLLGRAVERGIIYDRLSMFEVLSKYRKMEKCGLVRKDSVASVEEKLELFCDAAKHYEEASADPLLSEEEKKNFLRKAGEMYESMSYPEGAILCYGRAGENSIALELCREIGDSKLASFFEILPGFEAFMEEMKKGKVENEEEKELSEKVRVLNKELFDYKAREFEKQRRCSDKEDEEFQEAEKYLYKMIDFYSRTGNSRRLRSFCERAAFLQLHRGNYDEAIELTKKMGEEKAAEALKKISDMMGKNGGDNSNLATLA